MPLARLFLACLLALLCLAAAQTAPSPQRIVSIGGAMTQTVVALGLAGNLVAVDLAGGEVVEARALPNVGSHRALSAEGILALSPTILLVNDEAGPPAVLEQLAAAGVRVVRVPEEHTLDGAAAKVRLIADALGAAERGEALATKIHDDAAVPFTNGAARPSVLFLYARGPSVMMASGTGTAAHAMIELAGATNSVSGYEGYRPLTAEAAVAAAPDVILVTAHGVESVGGIDGVLSLPGVSLTPAGKARRIVAMQDLRLLGFGPETGAAVRELATALRSPANASPATAPTVVGNPNGAIDDDARSGSWVVWVGLATVAACVAVAILASRRRRRAAARSR